MKSNLLLYYYSGFIKLILGVIVLGISAFLQRQYLHSQVSREGLDNKDSILVAVNFSYNTWRIVPVETISQVSVSDKRPNVTFLVKLSRLWLKWLVSAKSDIAAVIDFAYLKLHVTSPDDQGGPGVGHHLVSLQNGEEKEHHEIPMACLYEDSERSQGN